MGKLIDKGRGDGDAFDIFERDGMPRNPSRDGHDAFLKEKGARIDIGERQLTIAHTRKDARGARRHNDDEIVPIGQYFTPPCGLKPHRRSGNLFKNLGRLESNEDFRSAKGAHNRRVPVK